MDSMRDAFTCYEPCNQTDCSCDDGSLSPRRPMQAKKKKRKFAHSNKKQVEEEDDKNLLLSSMQEDCAIQVKEDEENNHTPTTTTKKVKTETRNGDQLGQQLLNTDDSGFSLEEYDAYLRPMVDDMITSIMDGSKETNHNAGRDDYHDEDEMFSNLHIPTINPQPAPSPITVNTVKEYNLYNNPSIIVQGNYSRQQQEKDDENEEIMDRFYANIHRHVLPYALETGDVPGIEQATTEMRQVGTATSPKNSLNTESSSSSEEEEEEEEEQCDLEMNNNNENESFALENNNNETSAVDALHELRREHAESHVPDEDDEEKEEDNNNTGSSHRKAVTVKNDPTKYRLHAWNEFGALLQAATRCSTTKATKTTTSSDTVRRVLEREWQNRWKFQVKPLSYKSKLAKAQAIVTTRQERREKTGRRNGATTNNNNNKFPQECQSNKLIQPWHIIVGDTTHHERTLATQALRYFLFQHKSSNQRYDGGRAALDETRNFLRQFFVSLPNDYPALSLDDIGRILCGTKPTKTSNSNKKKKNPGVVKQSQHSSCIPMDTATTSSHNEGCFYVFEDSDRMTFQEVPPEQELDTIQSLYKRIAGSEPSLAEVTQAYQIALDEKLRQQQQEGQDDASFPSPADIQSLQSLLYFVGQASAQDLTLVAMNGLRESLDVKWERVFGSSSG